MWDKFQGAWTPLGPLKGTRFQRGPKGGSSPWILSFILIPISGQAPWFYLWKVGLFEFYFHPTWDLVPILFSDVSPFQFRSNLHLWLERKKKTHPWLMKSPAKLASNCNKGAWNLFCWALLPCLSNSPLNISSPWNLIALLNFQVKRLNLTQTKRIAKSCASSVCELLSKGGPSLEEKPSEEIKSMSPTLIDEPLCKTGINHRCTFFLGKRVTCLSAFAPRKRKPCQYYLLLEIHFLLNFHDQGQILKLIQKTRNQILDTNVSPGPPSAPG